MAKKQPAKPLLAVKFEFQESLDAFCHEALMLLQAVEMTINHGGTRLGEAHTQALRERADAFRAAMFAGDPS